MYDKNWQININDLRISEYFKLKEFDCPCCHKVMISGKIMELLELIRKQYGEPIIITSGYRCEIQNLRVGGVWDSKHLYGEAEDLAPLMIEGYEKLEKECRGYDDFIDIGTNKEKGYIHIELQV